MENNYETLRMPELKALMRECRLRNHSHLRIAESIAFLQNNNNQAKTPPPPPPQRHSAPTPRMSTWEPNRLPQTSAWKLEHEWENEVRQPKLEAPLTKRQFKHRRNKNSKLAKKFKNLEAENDNLKSCMEELEDKITKASQSTNAKFKRKKVHEA